MKKIKKYLLLMFIVFMAFLATFFASPKILDPIFTQQEKIVNIDSLKSKTINKYEAYKSQVSNVNPELVSVDKTKVSGGFMKEIGGVVYVGTSEKGLMRFDKKTKKLVLVNKTNVSDGFIKEIGGVVYVGTYDKGLMRLDKKTNKLVLVDKTNVSGGFIKEIGGVVYVGTTYNGLMMLDKKTKKLVLVNKTIVSYGFMEEIGGVVYVGTEGNGLMRLDKKTKKMVSVDTTNVAAGFMKEIGGVVYVGTTSGLMRLDEKTKKLVVVDKEVKTSYGFMKEIGGVVYVGTWGQRLRRLDEKTKKLVVVDKTNVTSGFIEEIGGVVYVGTYDKGLMRLDFTNVQNENSDDLNINFNNKEIQNQGLVLVSKIAKQIKDVDSLIKYTGIKFPKLNRYSTLKSISATSKGVSGTINLKIILNVGAGEQTINISLQGKTDTDVKAEIAKEEAEKAKEEVDKKQEQNIDKMKGNNVRFKILHQNIKTVDVIADEINSSKDIDSKISAVNKWLGTNLTKNINETKITGINAKPNPNIGMIEISITTYTKGASKATKTFKIYASGMNNAEIIDLNTRIFNIKNNKPSRISGIKRELIIIIGLIGGGLLIINGIIFFTLNKIYKRKK